METFRIGTLAERAGTNAPTIRYYEEIGLLRPPDRRSGGQRMYGSDDVQRLTFIRRCRDLGFSIDQVRWLVTLVQDRERSCLDARDLVSAHLEAVRAKLRDLQGLETSLGSLIREADASCEGGPGCDCSIVAELSTPVRRRTPLEHR